jgi:hypothetical protein
VTLSAFLVIWAASRVRTVASESHRICDVGDSAIFHRPNAAPIPAYFTLGYENATEY